MIDFLKKELVRGSIALFIALISVFSTYFLTKSSAEKTIITTLSGYFETIEKDMSYEEAIKELYRTVQTTKTDKINLTNTNENLINILKIREDEISKLQQKIEVYQEKTTLSVFDSKDISTLLIDIPIFNLQYYDDGIWEPAKLCEWDKLKNKAADGKIYKNALPFAIKGNGSFHAQTIVMDFLLNKNYTFFSSEYMLTEDSKSTPVIATMKIWGDERLLYTSPKITGGFVPVTFENLDVSEVIKMRIEIVSEDGTLENYRTNFGLVFIEPKLL